MYNNYNNNNENNTNRSLGGIWIRKSPKGTEYFTFSINGKYYVAFKNNYKSAPNQPDYQIFESNIPRKNETKSTESNATNGYNRNYSTQSKQEERGRYNNYGGYNKDTRNKNVVEGEEAINAYYTEQNRNFEKQNNELEDIPTLGNEPFTAF